MLIETDKMIKIMEHA